MASYASALRVAEGAGDAGVEAAVALPVGADGQPPRLVVVDSSAIIRGAKLERLADAAVTVPAVLAEVRDGPSRAALAALPFGLATRAPSDESMAAVRRFARLTGDAAVLSVVDTQLVALTHTLEVEAHGSAHLRDTPAPPRAAPRRRGRSAAAPMPGWDYVDNAAEWEALEREEADAAAARAGDAPAAAEPPAADQRASRVANGVMQLSIDDVKAAAAAAAPEGDAAASDADDADDDGWEDVCSRTTRVRRAKCAQRAAEAAAAEAAAAEVAAARAAAGGDGSQGGDGSGSESGSDESGSEDGAAEDPSAFQSSVALVTSDFAMQNVALQMGLRLIAPDGLRITRLQRWVLRCHACFGVTRDVGRHFCGRCGNATLQRVTLTVDAAGAECVGVRKRHNLRGTRYSLPAPRGGRYAVNPVLREDQLAAMRLPSRGNKPAPEADVFAVEFSQDVLFERPGQQQPRAANLAAAGAAPVVGRGRNPNERRFALSNRRR